MWNIAKHEDTVRYVEIIAAQTTPAFGYQRSSAGSLYRVENERRHCVRIINYDRTKSNINWRFTCCEKLGEVWLWCVICGQVQKEKTSDGNMMSPVFWFGY